MQPFRLRRTAKVSPEQSWSSPAESVPAESRMVGVSPRLDSLDLLRGIVMVLMALDHVRFFLHRDIPLGIDPFDLTKTNAALFFTRWITHFCAPVFVLLAGTGAYLYGIRRQRKAELAKFLYTRGFWLIFLEFTVVRFGWTFNLDFHLTFAVVLWALGCSMIALAALIYLPTRVVASIGLAMIVFHNLFDGIQPQMLGSLSWVWTFLHTGGPIKLLPNYVLVVVYPLVPWIGVMAAGYGLGALMTLEPQRRRKTLLALGIALVAMFFVLRASNVYGDPQPWTEQPSVLLTILSFLNCEKYPPSLLFLLMTIGPSLILLALWDRRPTPILRPIITFGRVPLFYYLLHLPLIHVIAFVLSYARYGRAPWLFTGPPWSPRLMAAFPKGYGYDLSVVYLIWIATVILLYPACRWFAAVKQRKRAAWLSYL
jgi:uncharacterized membrane protein